MVRDGEGAEHAVRVVVEGARDAEEAERVARAVGDSPLVKTAIFGRDPNWGRVTQAVGAALAGRPGPFPEPDVRVERRALRLGRGAAGARPRGVRPARSASAAARRRRELWVCDLTHGYVTINAEYHT